jgi:hypothetical protein
MRVVCLALDVFKVITKGRTSRLKACHHRSRVIPATLLTPKARTCWYLRPMISHSYLCGDRQKSPAHVLHFFHSSLFPRACFECALLLSYLYASSSLFLLSIWFLSLVLISSPHSGPMGCMKGLLPCTGATHLKP